MVSFSRAARSRIVASILSVFTLSVVLPSAVGALSVNEALRVGDARVVSRGDFVRAAVKVLGVKAYDTESSLPYLRVSSAMEPYIRAAHEKYALRTFGRDLQLARSITRGQALQVLVALQSLEGSREAEYSDVRKGTEESKVVAIAVAEGWMEPMRGSYFGVRRVLKGDKARILLRKVVGEDEIDVELPERLQRSKAVSQTIRIDMRSGRSSLPKTEILETIWQLLNDEFLYEENINADEAAYKAAEAIVRSLSDPYTTFLRPAGISNLNTQIDGEVSGIGAQVEQKDGILTIVSPLRKSPAEKAGLLPNDQILEADGVSLTDLEFMDAVNYIRGEQGTTVTLRIRRSGNEFDVNVIRGVVKVPEVEIVWQGDVCVVHLLQFGRTTETQLREALMDVQKQDPSGVVLDLRNNPGGLLHAATTVVSNFVSKGTTVAQIHTRDGIRTDATEFTPTISMDVPLVVLVNEGSASASEIVAGALQDASRAIVVGTTTFGKGTVQQVVQFNDDSGLKMTIAEWRTPLGRTINDVGIEPDVVVEYDVDRDVQLKRALELLR